jgi:hypothetical protein
VDSIRWGKDKVKIWWTKPAGLSRVQATARLPLVIQSADLPVTDVVKARNTFLAYWVDVALASSL